MLYSTQKLHFATASAYGLYAGFASLLTIAAWLGGYISNKFGYKYSISVGLVFCAIGAGLIGLGKSTYYIGLAIYTAGHCFCIPAFFVSVGLLYAKEDLQRDTGYTIFYLIFNIGALISSIAIGYLSVYISYQSVFFYYRRLIINLFFIYYFSQKIIKSYPGRSMAPQIALKPGILISILIVIGILLSIPLFFFLA